MPLTTEEVEEIRRILGREPTLEELAMFEAQWSEHCSYKSSRVLLKLLPSTGRHVIVGVGRDAPAVELYPDTAVVFKIESHNHPSAVDPYNGAATGIGGIVRDILAMGAKPIALLDMLYLGDPGNPHANWLIRGIVRGISDYGNRIGVPTVAGDTFFDSRFNRQPLVNVACVGVASRERLVLSSPRPGDLIIVMGNATGRDGLLGSSFASKALSDNVDSDIGAVQVGDPLTEKLLIDAIQVLVGEKLVSYIKDLGGGGLTTAISEVAAEHGLGAVVHLEKLHTRQSLSPLELLVSESQERMLLSVEPEVADRVAQILEKFDVSYSVIGHFDDSGRIRVYHGGRLVADVPARDLAKPKAVRRDSRPPNEALKGLQPLTRLPTPPNLKDAILKLLSSPNTASKRWIFEQYDYEVGIRTAVKPGYGDAAVLRLLDGSCRGLAVKGDANPRYTSLDPFTGAANTVAECFRNLVAVGSRPIAIVDELNAGNPEKPEHYWYFEMMLKGVAWMAGELGLPVVGGKVSFYNEDSQGRQVRPTATIVGVGRIRDVRRAATMDFKQLGSLIVVVGATYPELGGSEYLSAIFGIEEGEIPRPRPATELRNAKFVYRAIRRGLVRAVHDISGGGLAVALLEMAVRGGVGFEVDLSKLVVRGDGRFDEILFSETQARYIIEADENAVEELIKYAQLMGVDVSIIGRTAGGGRALLRYDGGSITVELDEAASLYERSFEDAIEGGV
ncbi:MAG: phosphoribosylformylglycinamidine synthase subunit PurL [Ignisphaera sp.]|nr:phosphoribosylformylglycinamidine synthase subunit PurL [Ignisphaera sp.]MDW8084733.1 phosphoribosylformylglycinamidine synthase subunit PurL [Ignisphaera sp.]